MHEFSVLRGFFLHKLMMVLSPFVLTDYFSGSQYSCNCNRVCVLSNPTTKNPRIRNGMRREAFYGGDVLAAGGDVLLSAHDLL